MPVLKLPEVLTHAQASDCARSLKAAVRAADAGDGRIVADATALAQFDSSALAVLLDCRREALANGKTFFVRALPQRLRQLAGLYGVASLIPAAD
jgi:phospholipid transport system transporter-binding protein